MTETVELRNIPELKFILKKDGFDIIDASKPKNSGAYSYFETKSVELNSERINWLISILSIIVEFLTGVGNGGIFRSKTYLMLHMHSQDLKIWLNNADLGKAEKIKQLIESKKHTHKTSVSKH